MAVVIEDKNLDPIIKLENIEDLLEYCRVCMRKRMNLKSVFSTESSQTVEELQFCTGILMTKEDGLPASLCEPCLFNLSIAYKFKRLCLRSDVLFRKVLGQKILDVDYIKKENISDTEQEYGATKHEIEDDTDDHTSEDYNLPDLKFTVIKAPSKTKRKGTKNVKRKIKDPDLDPDKGYQSLFCDPCNMKFTGKELLLAHKRNVHGCEWICEICGKQFIHRSSHYSHMQSHLPPRYNCEHCDYKTWHKADMNKHVRIHTGEKKFICEHCTSSFNNTSNLHGHIRRHHHGRIKSHACPRCDLSFYTTDKLRRHLDTHDNIKRFECDVCHAHFTRRCHWKKHLLKQHNVEVPRIRPGRQKVNIVKDNLESKVAV